MAIMNLKRCSQKAWDRGIARITDICARFSRTRVDIKSDNTDKPGTSGHTDTAFEFSKRKIRSGCVEYSWNMECQWQ
jgi:hypothetical protein